MQIRVEGETSGRGFHRGGASPIAEQHFHFTATIEDCKWLIRITGGPGFDYIETGTDGKDVFALLQNESFQKEHNVRNAGIGDVQNGSVPHVVWSPVTSIIWYAYASSCYLQHAGTQIELPFADVARNQYDTNWLSDAVLNFEIDAPRLPKAIFFRRDRIKYWERPIDALSEKPLERKMKAPFENGYTNAIFQVSSWTNFEGLVIPSDTSYRTYAPIKGQLVIVQELKVILHKVTQISAEQPTIPKIVGTAIVRDERFASGDKPVPIIVHDSVSSWPKPP